jgi:uncharacterized protein YndB with AHSA1/START domain
MKITVASKVDAPLHLVWRAFNDPAKILQWDGSPDWQTTWASNDLRVGGRLELRIEAKDGTSGFDVSAVYMRIESCRLIEWRTDAGQEVRVEFRPSGAGVVVRQTFDAEPTLSEAEQRADW